MIEDAGCQADFDNTEADGDDEVQSDTEDMYET
jgi:hypothetical protein